MGVATNYWCLPVDRLLVIYWLPESISNPMRDHKRAFICHWSPAEESTHHPGATKFWDKIFLPMHPLFPPHCNPRILCPENHFCFGFSCLSSPLSLSPAEPEKLFIFPSPLILLLQCKTEGSCKPFGEKITLCLDVTTLQQHRGPFLFSKN